MNGPNDPSGAAEYATPGQAILWRRLDRLGHESARLSALSALSAAAPEGSGWRLAGAAAFAHEGEPCLLSYTIRCDAAWRTLAADVTGWVGASVVETRITRDAADHWSLNGERCPAVDGCLDVDLNFSPATNLLPIRRLALAIGQSADVQAAWLRFPGFTLERLPQRYQRIGDLAYRYESSFDWSEQAFTANLTVNAAGFVTRYPRFWAAVATLG